jgi:hypothetical protein
MKKEMHTWSCARKLILKRCYHHKAQNMGWWCTSTTAPSRE